jgi:CubicO group peptidase (beta-lactamase class C family)
MNFEHQLDNYIAAEMLQKHIPGVSLAVVKDGSIVVEKGYGFANLEDRIPATQHTVYEIASITKSFTASAIMLLAEAGELHLDDLLTYYHHDVPQAWADLTVRHLLTHTSGVQQWSIDWSRPDLTPDEICCAAFGRPLRFAPGTRFEYCDTNYNLLGMIIHQLTGKPYDAFLQERIFMPLGMAATRHNDVRTMIPQRAVGYDGENGRLVRADTIEWNHINLSSQVPANGANGSLLSTVADLLKWETALFTGSILSRSVLGQMWQPFTLPDGTSAPYGLGWELETYRGQKLVAHGGGIFGFTTSITRFVDNRLTIIILTNQDSKPWDMAKEIAGMFVLALAV